MKVLAQRKAALTKALGMALVMSAASLWALVGLLSKTIYQSASTDPLSLGVLRLLLASPLLFGLSALLETPRPWQVERRDWSGFLLFGICVAAYQLCFLSALTYTSVTTATLILSSAPIFVTLCAALFLKERLTWRRDLLLVLAITGVSLVVRASGGGTLGGSLLGNLLALGAALAYAGYYLCTKLMASRYRPIQVMAIAMTAGGLILLPVTLLHGLHLSYPLLDWLFILVLAWACTGFSYTFYGWGMRRIPVSTASICALIEPVVAATLASIFLGETLSPLGWGGAALLLGSITLLYLLG